MIDGELPADWAVAASIWHTGSRRVSCSLEWPGLWAWVFTRHAVLMDIEVVKNMFH